MKDSENLFGVMTTCVHAGERGELYSKGLVTPIYTSSAYDYDGVTTVGYPRYFNTPNQIVVARHLAALEQTEAGLVFSSGLAAIMTSLLTIVKTGDHIILQQDIYGGTHSAVTTELSRLGISYTFVDGTDTENFERAISENTRAIYIETPSNPTLRLTDIKQVADVAKAHNLTTIIDNTFASPINQNPATLGIDIVTHSGTKYIGGHSDLCLGVALSSHEWIDKIRRHAINLGASVDPFTCYLAERSLKTMALRVSQQNHSAMAIATFLAQHTSVKNVHYPGLESHPQHELATRQMRGGFGGMLSFDLAQDGEVFIARLKLIRRAISLGGVESTICSPSKTSHIKMSAEDRLAIGVTEGLVRLSVGIEDTADLIKDLEQALSA